MCYNTLKEGVAYGYENRVWKSNTKDKRTGKASDDKRMECNSNARKSFMCRELKVYIADGFSYAAGRSKS